MLSVVLGLFSQDLAVDPGTSRTRVHLGHSGVVCDEPTVVAVHTDRHGRRSVLAVGEEALPMLGRTPEGWEVIEPIRDGRVVDFEVAEAFLLHLVRRIHGRNGWMRPKMLVPVPHGASDMEIRALRDSCESAGAREVQLVPRPVAAGLGAGLPIHAPAGHLVVDCGGGSTEVSILSLAGVVRCETVPGGGVDMDEAIRAWLQQHHGLLVGHPTAQRLKHELGSAWPGEVTGSAVVKGRCLERGVPRAVAVRAEEVREALAPRVLAIAEGIRRVVESAPPELADDIVDNGAVLVGDGANLKGIEFAIRHHTGLPVVIAERPAEAVVSGVGRLLEDVGLKRAVAS